MEIYNYVTFGGKDVIETYIGRLPGREQTKIRDAIEKIHLYGFEAFQENMIITRSLQGKLWEIKISHTRMLHMIRDSRSVYFLNICRKTKGYAEKREIRPVLKRAGTVTPEVNGKGGISPEHGEIPPFQIIPFELREIFRSEALLP
jgi:hypothetical protein